MYKKGAQNWLKHLDFMIWDLICLQLSFVIAYVIRHSMYGIYVPYKDPLYKNMAIVMALIEICVIIFFQTLKNVMKRGYYKEFLLTLKNVSIVIMLSTFYLFTVQEGNDFSRITLLLTGILYAVTSYLVRILWKLFAVRTMKFKAKRSLLIITTSNLVNQTKENIKDKNYEIFTVSGIAVIDSDKTDIEINEINGVKVVANRETVLEYVCRKWIDEVIINLPSEELLACQLAEAFLKMGVTVHTTLAKTQNLEGQKQIIERIGAYTVLTTSINYATTGQLVTKRLFDILGGAIGCIFTMVLFIFLAPFIYIKSPGPIFFSQVRVGKNGKKFRIYKFRSMYPDAEKRKNELESDNIMKDGMMFKVPYDSRIIGSKKLDNGKIKKGFGNYIRDFSLDEFPQFFNILKGDMSLVGTRPPTVDEWEKYDLHHRARLAIKPGLTGMWQISGRNKIRDFEEIVKLDRKYITDWNLGLDIKILIKTIGIVIGRVGAM